jgi:hypothetical protein
MRYDPFRPTPAHVSRVLPRATWAFAEWRHSNPSCHAAKSRGDRWTHCTLPRAWRPRCPVRQRPASPLTLASSSRRRCLASSLRRPFLSSPRPYTPPAGVAAAVSYAPCDAASLPEDLQRKTGVTQPFTSVVSRLSTTPAAYGRTESRTCRNTKSSSRSAPLSRVGARAPPRRWEPPQLWHHLPFSWSSSPKLDHCLPQHCRPWTEPNWKPNLWAIFLVS